MFSSVTTYHENGRALPNEYSIIMVTPHDDDQLVGWKIRAEEVPAALTAFSRIVDPVVMSMLPAASL